MRTEQLTRRAPVPEPATPERPAGRARPVAAALLGLVLVAGTGAWVAGAFDGSPGRVPPAAAPLAARAGTPVQVPGGEATVTHVEHIPPADLGVPLPDDAHAVEVELSVTAGPGGASFDPAAVRLVGRGVVAPIPPTTAEPAGLQLAAGGGQELTLRFVVPDASTELVLVLPGGGRVSAEHDNHPGDAAPGAG